MSGKGGRARAGPRGIRENMEVREGALFDKAQRGGVVVCGFAGEACDYICADRGVRQALVNQLDTARVVFGAIPTVHRGENAVAGRLQGHVEVRCDASIRREQLDEVLRNIEGLDGAKAQTVDLRFAENAPQKFQKLHTRTEVAAVASKMNAAKNDFAKTGIGELL